MKRIFALLLCIMLVVSSVPVTTLAAGGTANVSMVVNAPAELKEGDTFTVAVSYSDMTVSSFACAVKFDTNLLSCESIVGPRGEARPDYYYLTDADWGDRYPADAVSTPAEANANGYVGFAIAGSKDITFEGHLLFTITFKAKASTAADSATLTLSEDSSGTDGCKNNSVATEIVPVAPATPACEHENTKLVANNDGTHNVVCANADCGEVVTANVKCSGTDDGDHTIDVKCACGNTVTPGTAHKDETPKDHVCDVEGCNFAMGEHKSNAQYACQAGICEYCKAEMPATAAHVYDNACDATCNVCSATRTPADHVYDNACDATCNVCGATRTPADHVYTDACDADCNVCGVTRTPADHVYDNACDATCNVCSATRTPADHVYDNACDATCNVCGATRTPADHVYTDACDADCNVCGAIRTPADHVYTDACDADCNVCGAIRTPADHVYDNACDADCNVCGTTRTPAAHTGGTATCTQKAVCDVCGVAYGDEPAGHSFTNKASTTEKATPADCENAATYYVQCDNCDAVSGTQTVAVGNPLGHGKTAGFRYDNNTGDTHDVICKDCGKKVETVNHNFTDFDYQCECGAKFTGWEGKVYYKDAVMQTGWTEIEGAWYYLNAETGVRAEGMTRVPYPTEVINDNTYGANEEASEYAASKNTTFIDEEEAWFYFDEDGKFLSNYTGLVERVIVEKNEDGEEQQKTVLGYIAKGMMTWHPGVVEVGEDSYYFIGDVVHGGNIPANGDTYIVYKNNSNLVQGAPYHFTNGKLSGYNGIVDGKYYVDSRLMIGNGLTKLGENYIYVRSNGQVVMNAEYYVGANTLGIVTGTYKFDGNGFMVEPKFVTKEGIVDGYYYVGGKIAYNAGVIQIDGSYYYVRSNGQVVMNRTYWTTNVGESGVVAKMYTFAEDGTFTPEFVSDLKNGVVEENGILYYYENGHKAYDKGLIEYNGGYIYVRSNGQVATGEYYVTNVANYNGTNIKSGDKLTFGEDGLMIVK